MGIGPPCGRTVVLSTFFRLKAHAPERRTQAQVALLQSHADLDVVGVHAVPPLPHCCSVDLPRFTGLAVDD